ncbi:conserved hypothetical protein [Ricinus communis]|uniref:Uncharacterized protein n=1 Tax=Ricinus communis TaxID=3988 RepID=B9TD59_RICCO|nr:conserved hypothetical protein [Ricinus communis]
MMTSASPKRFFLAGDHQPQPQADEDRAGHAVHPLAGARRAIDPRAHRAGKIAQQSKQQHRLRREQHAQLSGLPGRVTARRHHKLRQERQEEQHHLRIDHVGEQPLGEQFAQAFIRQGGAVDARPATAAQGADAEPDQIRAAEQLERAKRQRRGLDQGADAERRQQRVTQAAQRAAETERHALAAPARHADAEHHQVVRAGRNGDQQRGAEKADELFW